MRTMLVVVGIGFSALSLKFLAILRVSLGEALYLFIDLLCLDNGTVVVRKFLTMRDRVK